MGALTLSPFGSCCPLLTMSDDILKSAEKEMLQNAFSQSPFLAMSEQNTLQSEKTMVVILSAVNTLHFGVRSQAPLGALRPRNVNST